VERRVRTRESLGARSAVSGIRLLVRNEKWLARDAAAEHEHEQCEKEYAGDGLGAHEDA
jgi:hypothetical protein